MRISNLCLPGETLGILASPLQSVRADMLRSDKLTSALASGAPDRPSVTPAITSVVLAAFCAATCAQGMATSATSAKAALRREFSFCFICDHKVYTGEHGRTAKPLT